MIVVKHNNESKPEWISFVQSRQTFKRNRKICLEIKWQFYAKPINNNEDNKKINNFNWIILWSEHRIWNNKQPFRTMNELWSIKMTYSRRSKHIQTDHKLFFFMNYTITGKRERRGKNGFFLNIGSCLSSFPIHHFSRNRNGFQNEYSNKTHWCCMSMFIWLK